MRPTRRCRDGVAASEKKCRRAKAAKEHVRCAVLWLRSAATHQPPFPENSTALLPNGRSSQHSLRTHTINCLHWLNHLFADLLIIHHNGSFLVHQRQSPATVASTLLLFTYQRIHGNPLTETAEVASARSPSHSTQSPHSSSKATCHALARSATLSSGTIR